MHVQLAFGQQQGDAEANNHREKRSKSQTGGHSFLASSFLFILTKMGLCTVGGLPTCQVLPYSKKTSGLFTRSIHIN